MLGLQGWIDKTKGMRFVPKIRDLKYEIKWACQRAWRGYDDLAYWNIDANFVELHVELLDKVISSSMSHPPNMEHDEWVRILKRMLQLLKRMDRYDFTNTDDVIKSKNKFFELFSEHFYDLWD